MGHVIRFVKAAALIDVAVHTGSDVSFTLSLFVLAACVTQLEFVSYRFSYKTYIFS